MDSSGNLYVADYGNDTIRKVTSAGVVTTLAGLAGYYGTNDGTNSTARFYFPKGIAVDSATNLYVADTLNGTIRKMTPMGTNWLVTTWAGVVGKYGSADGTGTNAQFYFPWGITANTRGEIYVADVMNSNIRKITSAGVVSTLAGSTGGASGDSADGVGSYARFSNPNGVAVDSAGNVYVADTYNHTIRQITSAGQVNTMAGLAEHFGGSDGPGSYARLNYPKGLALDSAGNVYVADTSNHTIRKVTPAGVVSTLAGLAGYPGSEDGTNSVARFNYPCGVAVDNAGNVYVADTHNDTIREVTPAGTNWVVTTIAGSVTNAGSADGTNSATRFHYPSGVAMDTNGNLYVADSINSTIREVTLMGTNWVVSTTARLASPPFGIAVDNAGNLYVPEEYNETIQIITPVGTNWVVSTIGGLASSSGSADGAGNAARFDFPSGIAVDSAGNIYVADTFNNTIRKGVFTAYGAMNAVAYNPPAINSSLTVTLLPPEANGQWRFPWEIAWHNSGDTESNLVAGNYPVEFGTLSGWLAIPPRLMVAVPSNSIVAITNQYYATLGTVDTNNDGSLTVTLGPNPPGSAFWGFLGEGPPSFPSGYSTIWWPAPT